MAKEGLTKKDLLSAIEKMTVLELADLVKALEEKFGVSAAAPAVAVAPSAAPATGGEATPAEEKTEFSVFITAIGDKKIQVIKEVRSATSLGLKEAKELVEGMSTPVVENVEKKKAEDVVVHQENVNECNYFPNIFLLLRTNSIWRICLYILNSIWSNYCTIRSYFSNYYQPRNP